MSGSSGGCGEGSEYHSGSTNGSDVYDDDESSGSVDTVGVGAHHAMSPGDELDDGKYEIVGRLGSGYFGIVWEAVVWEETNEERKEEQGGGEREQQHVAIKVSRGDPSYSEMYEEEIRLMQKIPPHPNCIALLDSFVFEGEGGQEHYSFVMPMMAGTDLFKFIRENVRDGERLNPIIAHHLSRQLLAGIAHLAEAGIVHSDLKIENLLVEPVESSTVLHLRIADFGTAMETGGRLRQYGHTYEYRAPEIIMGHRFGTGKITPAADVWSAATIIFELHMPRGFTLFESPGGRRSSSLCTRESYVNDHEHLQRIVSLFGAFGRRSIKHVRDHFTSRGELRREDDCPPPPRTSLAALFIGEGGGAREGERLDAFLAPLFTYSPGLRRSAKDALADAFMHAFAPVPEEPKIFPTHKKGGLPAAVRDAVGEAEAESGASAEAEEGKKGETRSAAKV